MSKINQARKFALNKIEWEKETAFECDMRRASDKPISLSEALFLPKLERRDKI